MDKNDIKIENKQLTVLYQNQEYNFKIVKSYEGLKRISDEIERGDIVNECK